MSPFATRFSDFVAQKGKAVESVTAGCRCKTLTSLTAVLVMWSIQGGICKGVFQSCDLLRGNCNVRLVRLTPTPFGDHYALSPSAKHCGCKRTAITLTSKEDLSTANIVSG